MNWAKMFETLVIVVIGLVIYGMLIKPMVEKSALEELEESDLL